MISIVGLIIWLATMYYTHTPIAPSIVAAFVISLAAACTLSVLLNLSLPLFGTKSHSRA